MSRNDDFTINEQALQEAREARNKWKLGEEADEIIRNGSGTLEERKQLITDVSDRVFLEAYYKSIFKL